MARPLSDDVRTRLLAAAERVFAEAGYTGATVASIAARAGVSTGNVYRYFADRDALFYAVCSDEFAARLLALVEQRVDSLVRAPDLEVLPEEAERDAEALLAFWVEHRRKVVILLDRAQGSRFADYPARFVEVLLKPTLAKLRSEARGQRIDAGARFVLEQVFRNTVRTLVAILEEHEEPREVRRAFQAFWSYQLAGLAGFTRWVTS